MEDYARNFSAEKRKKLAKEGKALPDGSFPIVNVSDLKNAISAYGRASSKSQAKRHIIKRARALGRTDLLPDDWNVGDKSMADVAEETFGGTIDLLRRAVRADNNRAYLVDASSSWLVYESYDRDSGEYSTYKRSYSLSDDGQVTLGDDETEVRRKTVYVPLAKQDAASSLVEIWGAAVASDWAYAEGQAVKGGNSPSDQPHDFSQEEGGHPLFCSDCGRSKGNPIHHDGYPAVKTV